MPKDKRMPIPTVLYVFTDERNIETILPSPQDTDMEIARLERDIAEQEALLKTANGDDLAIAKTKRDVFSNLLATTKQVRDVFLPQAERREYTLLRPTFGELLKVEKLPTVRVERNGTVFTDAQTLKAELLPDSIRGMEPEDVLDLSPDIAAHLWAELQRALYPEMNQLNFLS